ncbi:MAG: hypothetical protein AAF585_06045 [Verrucomicrobiota bacterium]
MITPASAQDAGGPKIPPAKPLTDSQIVAIKKQLESLKEAAKGNIKQRNGTAEQAFLAASRDPKAAVELYLACYKELNFTQFDREDRDYRAWEDNNEDRLEFGPYARGLQMQLQYLWMATRAAQAEDISTIFSDLTKFIEQIGQMTEPPHPLLDGSVANTVFARAYELDDLLNSNDESWELNPMSIGGIYEKTIYPYLRSEAPQNLQSAWDRRIAAETRLAVLFIEFEEGMERYQERKSDEPGQIRGEVNRMAGYVSNQYRRAMKFEDERLPVLKWGQAKDQYSYTDEALGVKAMLDIVQANIGHDNMNAWLAELEQLVASKGPDAPLAPVDAAPAGDDS